MKKKNRFFICFLAFTLLLTGINFSFTNTAMAATNSDLDNFDISLSWGDPQDNLSNPLTITKSDKEKEQIKLQVNIEYRGDGSTTFAPGDISFTVEDIKDIFDSKTGNYFYDYDVAAELVGSNSGIGDWYYTVEEEGYPTGENHVANKYTFTNKNEITGAFTSSVQLMFSLVTPEYTETSYSKTFNAALSVNGEEKTSDDITLNWTAEKDTWEIDYCKFEQLSVDTPEILSRLPEGADPDDYIFVQATYSFSQYDFTSVLCQGKLDIALPSDAIAGEPIVSDANDSRMFVTNTTLTRTDDGVSIINAEDDFGFWAAEDVTVPLAFPRDKYKDLTITLPASLSGVYYPETEWTFLDDISANISFPEFDYIYSGELYGMIKTELDGSASYYNFLKAYKDDSYLRDFRWKISLYTIYTGKPYDIVVGDDMSYAVYDDNTFRRLDDEETVITQVNVANLCSGATADVYGRTAGSDTYELFKGDIALGNNAEDDIELDVSEKKYCDVKIVYHNITQNIKDSFYIYNAYRINEANDNGKIPTCIYNMAYLDIMIDGEELLDDNTAITNITGIETDVDEHDKSVYGKKRYRATDLRETTDTHLRLDLYSNTSIDAVENGQFPIDLEQSIQLYDYVGGTEMESIDFEVTIGEHINYSLDDLIAEFNYDKGITLKSGKMVNSDNWRDYAEITSATNQDGTDTIKVHFDFSEDPYVTRANTEYNRIAVAIEGYTDYDDYVMLNLAGTKFIHDIKVKVTTVDGKTEDNNGTHYKQYPDNVTATFQGVSKQVISEKQEYYDTTAEAELRGSYTYKLRLTTGDTAVKYAAFFDNLEEAYGENRYWKGEFIGVDASALEEAGATPAVYYSASADQAQSLSASGWILSTLWTNPLSDVKAIAIDLGEYVIPTNSLAYVEINMKAPEAASGPYAYNKYSVSYKAYAAEAELMTEDNAQETIENLFSNVTTVSLPIKDQEVKITKKVYKEDYLEAHGNGETFIYKITSKEDPDMVWYKSIHFTKEELEGLSTESIMKTASVLLPYGTYTIEELSTSRFEGDIIDTSGNATDEGGIVGEIIVDSKAASEVPTLVYENIKERWDRFSHSDLVINTLDK